MVGCLHVLWLLLLLARLCSAARHPPISRHASDEAIARCLKLHDAASSVSLPSPLEGRFQAQGAGMLEGLAMQYDFQALGDECPMTVATVANNLAVLYMVNDRTPGQRPGKLVSGYQEVLAALSPYLELAKVLDPASLIILQNAAWLQSITASTREVELKRGQAEVLSLAALRYAQSASDRAAPVSYKDLHEQLVVPLGLIGLEASELAGKVDSFTLKRGAAEWIVSVNHTGTHHVFIGVIGPYEAQNFIAQGWKPQMDLMWSLLDPRSEQLSVFELSPQLCSAPVDTSDRYLNLLASEMLGLHSLTQRSSQGHRYNVSQYRRKPWVIMQSPCGVPTTVCGHDALLDRSRATRGKLNFLRAAVEQIEDRHVNGDIADIGSQEGELAMWLAASMEMAKANASLDGLNNKGKSKRDYWVASPGTGIDDGGGLQEFKERVLAVFDEFDLLDLVPRLLETVLHCPHTLSSRTNRMALIHIDVEPLISNCMHSSLQLTSAMGDGSVLVVDRWQSPDVRMQILREHARKEWLGPILPVPDDYVFSCRQGSDEHDLATHAHPSRIPHLAYMVAGSDRTFASRSESLRRSLSLPQESFPQTLFHYNLARERLIQELAASVGFPRRDELLQKLNTGTVASSEVETTDVMVEYNTQRHFPWVLDWILDLGATYFYNAQYSYALCWRVDLAMVKWHHLRLLFLHIPRTGGKVVYEIMQRSIGEEKVGSYELRGPFHGSASIYFQCWPESRHFMVFTVVRNPYERLLSAMRSVVDHHWETGLTRNAAYVMMMDLVKQKDWSFAEFVVEALDIYVHRFILLAPQVHYLVDHDTGEWLVEKENIVRFEDLIMDVQRLLRRRGLVQADLPLMQPNPNSTWSEKVHRSWCSRYTEAAQAKAKEVYAADLEHFGYSFDCTDIGTARW